MLKPLADRVLIRLEAKEGVVVAVGAGKVYDNGQRVAPEVKVGDTVMFAKYAGSELEIDGATHLIISERDILAVL